ncbi:glycosyl transferase, partial [bacterium]|nr:glycosyl transferase [bacterium]MBU1916855.1 glycosyl transferase [bacterium]
DWQIADWITTRVPGHDWGRTINPLSLFDRWKVFDNLRRSLLPLSSLAVLLTSWLLSPRAGFIASTFVIVQFMFHSIAQHFSWATTRQGFKSLSFSKIARDSVRVIVEAALLPYQSWMNLDAIVRSIYRRFISHRHLLEWSTAQITQNSLQKKNAKFLRSVGFSSVFSVLLVLGFLFFKPTYLLLAGPWLCVWFFAPLVAWLINRHPQIKQPVSRISDKDRQFLRRISRRTWRYFSDFVNENSSWLPPDNYQVSHQNQLAMRSSPTNIGLWMVSALSAHHFGYVTIDNVVNKLTKTFSTVDKLERYEGHLLNWYDIQTLAPLHPRYVSTVDSGNFLGALWTLNKGLKELIHLPLLDKKAFEGLCDTCDILKEYVQKEAYVGFNVCDIDSLHQAWKTPHNRVVDTLTTLSKTQITVRDLVQKAGGSPNNQENMNYWIDQLQKQIEAWQSIADRYLNWIKILNEKSPEDLRGLDNNIIPEFHAALTQAPSLFALAKGNVPVINSLERLRKNISQHDPSMIAWIDHLLEVFSRSKWLAGEALGCTQSLIYESGQLSKSINMKFLYNPERKLFSIGYNVSEGRLDRSFYDLLASEARLGSFIAIARGEVPVEHWFDMIRPYGAIGRHRVLLSWTGTMFEYLMPFLFQRSYGKTLLDKAAHEAVDIQIAYARKNRVPWGISESAFGDLDSHKTYQYYAFGVPSLGLKRGQDEKIVIAPYASLLAISVAPKKTLKNLKRLARLGLLSDHGYFEAIDFSRRSKQGKRGVIVRAYMAHHQGMGLLSITNFLHENPLQRYFHADQRVRTAEPLLLERIPVLPTVHHISTRERVSSIARMGEVPPTISQFDTPLTDTPKTQLLSNGRYALMVTNAGSGYSRWGDFDITRWRSDFTRDCFGTFCYIHDSDSKQLWCNTFEPTQGDLETFQATFTVDSAVFQRIDNGIETETEIIVAPEDDVEIRRITIINRSANIRKLDLTSYIELSMAPHNADRQHPAFNKLFIQTEEVPDHQAIIAYRRSRSDGAPPIYVAHCITQDEADGDVLQFETDRRQFIGRGRTLSNPMGAAQELNNSQGFVLDPILSLRKKVVLGPEQRVQISLVLAVGESRVNVLNLINKYSSPHTVEHSMDLVWAAAQVELRLLRIHSDEARRFQQLASHLIYPNYLLRSPAKRIMENRKGQSALWAYGISGDLPMVLVNISEPRDISLVRQILQAHNYWRMHGLKVDLIIINEEANTYEQPLREKLEHLILALATNTGMKQPGGVYLLSADLLPKEDLIFMRAVAHVVMIAARGTLPQQMGGAAEIQELPKLLVSKQTPRDRSAALPFLELNYFNSLGGFTQDGREYAIYLGPDLNTPAPWVNVIANPQFGTLISETGSGFTWQGNSQRNRLTEWSNDPVIDPSSEAIYIRDEETGRYWTPTASPIRNKNEYRTKHGAGYSLFEHNSHGINQELTVFVPMNEQDGEPVKLQRLKLYNDSGRPRILSLTYYVEWTLGENRESSQMHVVTHWDDDLQFMTAHNSYNPDYPNEIAFVAFNIPAESYTGDRTVFLGRNRSMKNPLSMERVRLSGRTGAGFDPCAALQVTVKLAPGEQTELVCLLGQAATSEHVNALVLNYRRKHSFETVFNQTKNWWDNNLNTIQIQTPVLSTNLLINRWLLYQTLSCRIWGRSAFYQSGGAFGFRDQLQDVMALLYMKPKLAREHILLAASRQFKEGDVQHWWHPPGGAGIRSRISDDLLWLPYVVAQYVNITNDLSILSESISFIDAPELESDQHEFFMLPERSSEHASLFEHCQRAVARAQKYGVHGLPLMGSGDWNDGMNMVGVDGRGESVWLAWFMVEVLRRMADMTEKLHKTNLTQTYLQERDNLIQSIEKFAWDDKWYLRATFDDGSLLGSKQNTQAQIDSLPQSWAWLCGAANNDRAQQALDSAWHHLVKEDEKLVLLFEPPFDDSKPSPGYIMGYPPGVRENGGQYTHAALWLAMAMAKSGDGDRASKIMSILNPIERTRTPEAVWAYSVEPYVMAADVYYLKDHIGMGGWSWYTGASSWMYRVWVEECLGLIIRGNMLQINPVISKEWDGFQISYQHGEALYEISVENPDHCSKGVLWTELDGRRVKDNQIALGKDLVKHKVVVRMGN